MADVSSKAPATTAIVGIDIAAVLVTDPKRSIAFYRDVLGIEPTSIDTEGRGAEFTLADGTTFGVWGDGSGATGPAFMFAVGDARAAVTEMRARGAQIDEPFETPVCIMAFGKDPDGNGYIIHQRTVRED